MPRLHKYFVFRTDAGRWLIGKNICTVGPIAYCYVWYF